MPEAEADYLGAEKKCDIVMKGGITSGVVYPKSVVKLAEVYRFRNIGGTSAGAIAAAATAAAEYRRSKGSGEGFAELAQLPAFLADKPAGKEHTNLFWLFQPDPAARMLFDIGVSLTKKRLHLWLELLVALIKGAWFVWVGVVLLAVLFRVHAGWLLWVLVIGLALVIWWKLRALPPKGFGLCPGTTKNPTAPPALTDWFHEFLNRLADKPPDEPLTFGDLSGEGIRLRMITTCVTHGRPYGLPIDSAQFYFKEDELREYFPASVIAWMKNHPGPGSRGSAEVDTSGFHRLPGASDMPVLVAARMSLSFPFLFRAVPLYAVDYSVLTDKPRVPERCWFLDGGICSNFPVFMFDAPLPRWPTFGIDLENVCKDRPDSFVWMPSRNSEGLGERWNRLSEAASVAPIAAYLVGLINAARNWTDSRQMTVPGYRDRIVHIRLDEKQEGGLNLDMDPDVVTTLSERGREAAELLISHFHKPEADVTLTWDNHRWIRLRSLLARLEELLGDIRKGLSDPEPGDRTYEELLERNRDEPPESYRFTVGQRELAGDLLRRLEALAAELDDTAENLRPGRGAPRPAPELRVLPRTVPGPDADRSSEAVVDPQAEGSASVSDSPD
jgi:hypothetical protein